MKKIGIGLLGFGVVGQGVWKLIRKNQQEMMNSSGIQLEIQTIYVRDRKARGEWSAEDPVFTTRWQDLIENEDVEIVVELMGDVAMARECIHAALDAGKDVVTANKALLALHGAELTQKAERAGVQLRYEASVAGGIPVLQALRESLSANRIESIMGIVNGTTNYILTRMTQEKLNFEDVLQEAQEKGYAEADPTADVDGYDAAHKLTILASLGFRTSVQFQQVYREGIQGITPTDIEFADELGYRIKLLAIARENQGQIELRVHPTMIPHQHPLAAVQDVFNAVYVRGNAVGELMFYGQGAGDMPTASAVVGDVINAAGNLGRTDAPRYPLHIPGNGKQAQPMEETVSAYYVRLLVKDIPGVLGRIATTFGRCGVSLLSVIQKGETNPVSLVFVTHKTKEVALHQAIRDIQTVDELTAVASVIRVEDL